MKDTYLFELRRELDLSSQESVGNERNEAFVSEIEDCIELDLRKGRSEISVLEMLGSPKILAHRYMAFAAVRSKRPVFTLGARLRALGISFKHHFMASFGRGLMTSVTSIPFTIVVAVFWAIALSMAIAGVAGIVSLITYFELSTDLEIGGFFFFAGLLFFTHLAATIAFKFTMISTGLIWKVSRTNARRGIEKATGVER
ncbi:MAG: hypothetical protein V4692_16545 [Bdellovibrionota bacterium]